MISVLHNKPPYPSNIIDFKIWKVKQGLSEWPQGANLHAFDPYRGKLVMMSNILDEKDEDDSLDLHLFSIPGSLFNYEV